MEYLINEPFLIKLGFVKNNETDSDEEIDERGWLWYNDRGKLGFQLVFIKEMQLLWIEKFYGDNILGKREWGDNVVSKINVYSDEELYFIMSRLCFFSRVLGIKNIAPLTSA